MRSLVSLLLSAGCTGGAANDASGDDDDDDITTPIPPDAFDTIGPDTPVVGPEREVGEFEGFSLVQTVFQSPRALLVYFHGGDEPSEVFGQEQIALTEMLAVLGFGVVTENWDLVFPSDHRPVLADVRLPAGPRPARPPPAL
jgi:hypothetical protein